VATTIKRFAPAFIALLLLAGCALTSHPRIADLKYNAGRYQNRNVTVEGVVTTSWGVPMVPFRLYKIDDGTGVVTVISQDGRVPNRGARVRVRGRVEDVATFGGQAVGLHIREQHVSFPRRW
jgi:hypothetical protein